MAVVVRVPAQERNVFGRHLDESRPLLDQPAGKQTAQAKPPRIVELARLLRLQRQVEGLGGRRVHQAVGACQRFEQRLALKIARAGDGAFFDQLFVRLEAAAEPLLAHAGRRTHGEHRLLGIGHTKRAVLGAEAAPRLKSLEFFRLAVAVVTLADVDEGRERRVLRTLRLGNPGADVRGGHRLRRLIAGVPVVLVPRMQNLAEVGRDVRANQRPPVEHRRNLFEPLGDMHAVDCRRNRGERAQARRWTRAPSQMAYTAWGQMSLCVPSRRPSRGQRRRRRWGRSFLRAFRLYASLRPAWPTGAGDDERAECGRAGSRQEFATIGASVEGHAFPVLSIIARSINCHCLQSINRLTETPAASPPSTKNRPFLEATRACPRCPSPFGFRPASVRGRGPRGRRARQSLEARPA